MDQGVGWVGGGPAPPGQRQALVAGSQANCSTTGHGWAASISMLQLGSNYALYLKKVKYIILTTVQ